MIFINKFFEFFSVNKQESESVQPKEALPDFLLDEVTDKVPIMRARQVALLEDVLKIMKGYPTTKGMNEYLNIERYQQNAPWQNTAEQKFVVGVLTKNAGHSIEPLKEELANRWKQRFQQEEILQFNNWSNALGTEISNSPFSTAVPLPLFSVDEALLPVVKGEKEWALGFPFSLEEKESLCHIAQKIGNLCGEMAQLENIDPETVLLDLMDPKRKVVNHAIPGFEDFTQDKEAFCWMGAIEYVRHHKKETWFNLKSKVAAAVSPYVKRAVKEHTELVNHG